MNYFDCHADTLTQIPPSETLMENTCCLDLARACGFGGNYTQIFAIWKDQAKIFRFNTPAEEAFRQAYRRALGLLQAQGAFITWCQNAADMQHAHAQGKAAAFLSVEDISVMGSLVGQVRDLGIRFATLTWNYENAYACGASAGQEKGLSGEGRALVRQLLAQGTVLDISHLSDQGTEDIFLITDRPVMASHSNVRAVCSHPRNLKTGHIRELIRRDGLMGINFYTPFVGTQEQPQMTELLRHLDAVLELGGENILAIGSDFDGCSQFVQGIEGVQSVPYLRTVLEREGFGEQVSEKILWKNAWRFVVQNVR